MKKSQCKECHLIYYSRFCIQLHSKVHKEQKDIQAAGHACRICAKCFKENKKLKSHLQHHGFGCILGKNLTYLLVVYRYQINP